jgi:lipoprotein-anchoring transpeptidase ErfK/SrfK
MSDDTTPSETPETPDAPDTSDTASGSRADARAEQRRHRSRRRRVVLVAIAAIVALLLVAGGVVVATQGDDSTAKAVATTTTTLPTGTGPAVDASFTAAPYRTATTKGADIPVYASPDANAQPVTTLPKQTEYLLPRSLLVFDQYADWLHVYLPTRPNSSTAWIKSSDVRVGAPLTSQIRVSLADRTLTLLHDGNVVFTVPAAIGTDENPTPTGVFYYTDPLDLASQPGTAYGVFAIGLSGHSNTLSEFAGGDGQIAIHGTNDPGTIGTPVSHGCVRVNNDVILKLAKLPLGTPVVIT